jgi:predicted MPP superfamily phosphohydrolase
MPTLPKETGTVRLLLLADLHVQAPDMTPARVERIVQKANALRADIVVLAGDFRGTSFRASGAYEEAQAIAPLAKLQAATGVYAVLGNNDRARSDTAIAALSAAGITVLESRAVQLGPIALGGLRTRYGSTIRRLLALQGTRILVSHSPDGFAQLPPGVHLMLAGHTHCGQVVLPFLGALATGSQYGDRYRCGITVENGRTLVVTAGLGTSNVPFRIGAPPDMWLVELKPS